MTQPEYEVGVRGFWDGLGVDDGGLPVHMPIPCNEKGQGPQDEGKAVSYACWCGRKCPLNEELQKAWRSGIRIMSPEDQDATFVDGDPLADEVIAEAELPWAPWT